MRALTLITAIAVGLLLGGPALAADAMMSSSMESGAMMSSDAMGSNAMGAMGADARMATIKAGEVVAVMPGGQMGTSMMAGDKMTSTIGMAKAIDRCLMFITGPDGKVYQVDTSSAAGEAECEGIAK